jgi:hypothetical protein
VLDNLGADAASRADDEHGLAGGDSWPHPRRAPGVAACQNPLPRPGAWG